MTQAILFYIFAALLLLTAGKCVTSQNPMEAALWLVASFWVSACEWMLMQAEFLSVILVMIYIGAVMVLVLFVIMMLNISVEELKQGFWRNLPLSLSIGVLMTASLVLVLLNGETNLADFGQLAPIGPERDTVREFGEVMYTQYLMPFELAAALLVLGMVSAIALVHRRNENPKYIQPSEQVEANPADRCRIVEMRSETEKPADARDPASDAAQGGPQAKGEGK